jgi:hypothetical protein
LFSGQVDAEALRPAIDLQLTIAAPSAPWLQAATFTRDLDLNIAGTDTGWDVAMATGLDFAIGTATIAFDSVRVERTDDAETTVTVLFPPSAPFTVETLMGAYIPGLGQIKLEAITLGGDYVQGALTFGTSARTWDVLLSHPADLDANLFALWPHPQSDGTDELRLSDIINAGGLIDELSLARPTLIYSTPSEKRTVTLPTPLADRVGATLDLKSGITLDAIPTIDQGGTISSLLGAVGIAADSLFKLAGTLDPSALSKADAPSPDFEFAIPLPDILQDDPAVSFAGNELTIHVRPRLPRPPSARH